MEINITNPYENQTIISTDGGKEFGVGGVALEPCPR